MKRVTSGWADDGVVGVECLRRPCAGRANEPHKIFAPTKTSRQRYHSLALHRQTRYGAVHIIVEQEVLCRCRMVVAETGCAEGSGQPSEVPIAPSRHRPCRKLRRGEEGEEVNDCVPDSCMQKWCGQQMIQAHASLREVRGRWERAGQGKEGLLAWLSPYHHTLASSGPPKNCSFFITVVL